MAKPVDRPLPTIIDGRIKPAPERITQPGGAWSKFFPNLKTGDWFEVGPEDLNRVRSAGVKYMKGRYSLYKHPIKKDMHIFQRIR